MSEVMAYFFKNDGDAFVVLRKMADGTKRRVASSPNKAAAVAAFRLMTGRNPELGGAYYPPRAKGKEPEEPADGNLEG